VQILHTGTRHHGSRPRHGWRAAIWIAALSVAAVIGAPALHAQGPDDSKGSPAGVVLQDTTETDSARSDATVPGKKHVLRNTPVRYTPLFVWRETAVEAAAFALVAAFLLSIPVALVYRYTTTVAEFDPAIAQSILVLPTTVAGVILVIQGSLALAFSLAGVVTAVRFRSSLKDTDDAIYIFLAVAIGVAAGARALDIAVVVCVAVCLALLLVRAPRFVLSRVRLEPTPPGTADNGSAKSSNSAKSSDDGAEPQRVYTVLIHSGNVVLMQPGVEQVLTELTKDFLLTATGPSSGGVERLVYAVKLKKKFDARELEAALNDVATKNGGHADVTTGPASDDHTNAWQPAADATTGGLP
jgi:uncharacterized membrane protein YhiD involved in acid resistance